MVLFIKPIMYVCNQISLVNIFPHGKRTNHYRPAVTPTKAKNFNGEAAVTGYAGG